jgi:hypothetical protein
VLWSRSPPFELHKTIAVEGGPFPVQIIFDESCRTLGANKFNKCQQIPIYFLVRAKDCKKKQAGKIGNITKLEARLKMYHKKNVYEAAGKGD